MEQILSSEWLRGTPLPKVSKDQGDWVTLPTRINGATTITTVAGPVPSSASLEDGAKDIPAAPLPAPTPAPAPALTEIEALARERLAALGIGAALLNEHLDKGVRSPVIGTYRIAVHRLQKQASSQPATPENGSGPGGEAFHAVSVYTVRIRNEQPSRPAISRAPRRATQGSECFLVSYSSDLSSGFQWAWCCWWPGRQDLDLSQTFNAGPRADRDRRRERSRGRHSQRAVPQGQVCSAQADSQRSGYTSL